jgi:hypothetical protein
MRVITSHRVHPEPGLALELLARAAAIAITVLLVLGFLPLVMDSVG